MNILIVDGEAIFDVSTSVHDGNEVSSGRTEWLVFANSVDAGKRVRDQWEDMARNDKKGFRALIGDERVAAWGLEESDPYGISSLGEFLDAVEKEPESELASYDGEERDGYVNKPLMDELDDVDVEGAHAYYGEQRLRGDLVKGHIDTVGFPDDLQDNIGNMNDDVLDPDWAAFKGRLDMAVQTGDEWAVELRDTYTFYPVVCYRTN